MAANTNSSSSDPKAQGQMQQQFDPNALAQVMSFVSTPSGVQSMAAYANHMTSTGNANSTHAQSSKTHNNEPSPRYAPPQHAGQKRKLNDRHNRMQAQQNAAQQSSKPPRAKAAVPPQIPSFGFSLPPPPAVKIDNKRRKVNLGLSRQPLAEDSGEEEEMDEEAAYAQKLKGGGFAFEHEGEVIAIRTGAEVAAWIKDRRKNFPTQQRITEKAEAAARKRTSELDFLRRVQGKPRKDDNIDVYAQPTRSREESKDNQAKQESERRRQEELAVLRKKLHESMTKKLSAPAVVELGLGYDSETESDEESSVLSESSVVSSSEESEEGSEPDLDESDEAPERVSSKLAPPSIKAPPPARGQQSETNSNRICTNWSRNGKCPWFSKCKYQHPAKAEEIKLVGLYERMMEQELVKADQLALEAIRYLGQNGFLG